MENAKGSVSMTDAACINSICKWERHGILAQHWLREAEGKMTASDRLRFSGEIAKASDQRDRNLRLLDLDKKVDIWATLRQAPQVTDVEE
ncbi:hypothetical protein [Lacipirellula parvula]|nr:hypothetical protein [Lacipirellula parvula]